MLRQIALGATFSLAGTALADSGKFLENLAGLQDSPRYKEIIDEYAEKGLAGVGFEEVAVEDAKGSPFKCPLSKNPAIANAGVEVIKLEVRFPASVGVKILTRSFYFLVEDGVGEFVECGRVNIGKTAAGAKPIKKATPGGESTTKGPGTGKIGAKLGEKLSGLKGKATPKPQTEETDENDAVVTEEAGESAETAAQ